jgi:hypothetical protein
MQNRGDEMEKNRGRIDPLVAQTNRPCGSPKLQKSRFGVAIAKRKSLLILRMEKYEKVGQNRLSGPLD